MPVVNVQKVVIYQAEVKHESTYYVSTIEELRNRMVEDIFRMLKSEMDGESQPQASEPQEEKKEPKASTPSVSGSENLEVRNKRWHEEMFDPIMALMSGCNHWAGYPGDLVKCLKEIKIKGAPTTATWLTVKLKSIEKELMKHDISVQYDVRSHGKDGQKTLITIRKGAVAV